MAELVFHTLFAQWVAYDDNRHLYVKNTERGVVVTNGTSDPENTLAKNTFGMWDIDGIVTANSYIDDSLSETTNNAPRTDVLFDDLNDYMGSNKVSHYPFEYTTSLLHPPRLPVAVTFGTVGSSAANAGGSVTAQFVGTNLGTGFVSTKFANATAILTSTKTAYETGYDGDSITTTNATWAGRDVSISYTLANGV